MARIESIWHDAGETELKFCARWYFLPEESHAGRQPHHAAREVFLSQLRDEASVHSIVQKTGVQTPADYYRNAPAPEGVAGDDDVYLCEYEYDCVWQRFRRRTEWESDSEEEGEAWHAGRGAGSDDEGGDVTFKPVHATMDERRPRRGKQAAGGKKSRVLDDVLDTVGAMSIPEHVRRPAAASALGSARDALTLAAVPRSLPCREAERTTVERFVEEVLADGGCHPRLRCFDLCMAGCFLDGTARRSVGSLLLCPFSLCALVSQRRPRLASASTSRASPAPARRRRCWT